MSGPLHLDAPPGVIAALLDLANGSGSASAVRQSLGAPADLTAPMLERLVSAGALLTPRSTQAALSPVLRSAAGVLADPGTHVRIRLWSGHTDVTTSVYFSQAGPARPGVGLTEQGDRVRLTAPLESAALLNVVDAVFLSASRAVDRKFGALLDPDAARTLFGVLDWIRSGGGHIDVDAAQRHHASGATRASAVMFAPYVLLALGADPQFDRSRWDAAVRRLTLAGLLVELQGAFTLGVPIRALGYTSTAVTGAFQWEATMRDASGSLQRQSRIALALGPNLVLVMDRTDDGLFVHTPGVAAVRADVAAFVESGAEEPPRRRFCSQCGAAMRPSVSFCSACGAAVRQP